MSDPSGTGAGDDPLGTITGWIEVELAFDHRLAEIVSAVLFSKGATGAEEMDPLPGDPGRARIRAWFPVHVEPQSVEAWLSDLYRTAKGEHEDLAPVRIEVRSLEEKDWAESWKSCFAPLKIGRSLRIVPSWIDPSDGVGGTAGPKTYLVRLDPGMAFGTGTHPTTFMCLEHLEELAREKGFHLGRVWDWGSGSGILAIVARVLGASEAAGTDTSAQAIVAAEDNARLNGITDGLTFAHRSVQKMDGPFDLILANLYAEVLLKDGAAVLAKLAPGGSFITSGFVTDRAGEIEAMLRGAGLIEAKRSVRSDSSQMGAEQWAGLWWKRP